MAIKILAKGEISCDQCFQLIAHIETNQGVYPVIEDNKKYTKILCSKCFIENEKKFT